MKKLILLFALIGICVPCFAQSLSLTTFCKTSIEELNNRKLKLYNLKDQHKIEKTLASLGFTCKAKHKGKGFYDDAGEYYNGVTWTYSKTTSAGTTTVKCDGWSAYKITFPSVDAAKKFMAGVKAAGFKYNSGWGGYMIPGNENVEWTGVTINCSGSTVTINANVSA